MTKIGIIGSGGVGKTLADGFIKHGYEVKIGTRDVSKLSDWVNQKAGKGSVGSFDDAAKYGDLLVLAVKGTIATDVIGLISPENLRGKSVIDATNPIADKPPVNGLVQFFTDHNSSLMEQLQNLVPDANFVKAFSSIGAPLMVNPHFEEGKPTMFIAGNNEAAKEAVSKILHQFGFIAEDLGGATSARAIEPLCILWCIPGMLGNKWNHAFKLLKN